MLFDLILISDGTYKSNDIFDYLDVQDYTFCGIVVTSDVYNVSEPHILIPHNYGAKIISFTDAFKTYKSVAWCPIAWHPSYQVSPNDIDAAKKIITGIGPAGNVYQFHNGVSLVRQFYEKIKLIPVDISFMALKCLTTPRPLLFGDPITLA